ncbi:exonuclease SbcCD subunit D [Sporolituus thermophilus]|uniref:Nuclease SbcCD subunit D n=1 Tax=Sporolituus thermophilus DSM 23256 TaxID=1123285 RepID=A0A1G7JXU0_9FIRM|nr:exonuclease SbcCD subunit D [Sporolituus thermophilus]SDF29661.1 Exodeoxyribonuclease I subunit D [Sporolituus thermophilus DSM 23256]
MRILHTADWHLGKTLEGRDRQTEQEQFIDEICAICNDEAIQLVLIAGDVFQSYTPSAAAEELFYAAVDRLADHGRRAVVVIAGNHDSPERLCAAAPLADRLGITMVGLPSDEVRPTPGRPTQLVRRIDAGPSWLEVAVPGCDHTAVIAALPYPSESRLRELLAASLDDNALVTAYNDRLAHIFSQLAAHFRSDAVNLAVSHLYVRGGITTESEESIQLGTAYAVDPAVFPTAAQYIALGHLHRPQKVAGSAVPARYAGSPLAYSFSEAGHSKAVFVVDARPGQPAQIKEIPLAAGRPLVRWQATEGLQQVERWVAEGRDKNAWIDLEIHVSSALSMDDIQRLRGLHTGFIHIRPMLPQEVGQTRLTGLSSLSPEELFKAFYQRCNAGAEPDDALVRLFLELAESEESESA